MSMEWSPDRRKLLKVWAARSTKEYRAHYRSATSCRIYNYLLGVPLVILTTLVATQYFDSIRQVAQEEPPLAPRIASTAGGPASAAWTTEAVIFIVIVIITPILAALQTFLRFPERGREHKEAGARFESLLLEIERLLAWPPSSESEQAQAVERVLLSFTETIASYPTPGSLSLASVARRIKKETGIGELPHGKSPISETVPSLRVDNQSSKAPLREGLSTNKSAPSRPR